MTNNAMGWVRFFIYSAGAILLAGALIRFIIAAGSAQVLPLPEPMLGIPIRYAVLIVGGIELLVASICLFGKSVYFQIAWLAWLATIHAVYWIGLFSVHCHPQATCIGSLTDPLQLSRGTTGFITRLLPFYLLLGSYAALVWFWNERRTMQGRLRIGQVETIKMFCALCKGRFAFSSLNLGQKIPCPHCKATITLMRPQNLKMTCSSCGEHIEFPTHGIGEIVTCPHCTTSITLGLKGTT